MLTDTHDKALLHVKEAAVVLDVHPSTVRRHIAAGELDAVRLGPTGRFRVTREAIDRFLVPVAPLEKEAA